MIRSINLQIDTFACSIAPILGLLGIGGSPAQPQPAAVPATPAPAQQPQGSSTSNKPAGAPSFLSAAAAPAAGNTTGGKTLLGA